MKGHDILPWLSAIGIYTEKAQKQKNPRLWLGYVALGGQGDGFQGI